MELRHFNRLFVKNTRKNATGKSFGTFLPRYSQNYTLNRRFNPRMDTIWAFFQNQGTSSRFRHPSIFQFRIRHPWESIKKEMFFHKHRVNSVQLHIYQEYFKFEGQSMLIWLCINNACFACFKLSANSTYSNSNHVKNSD